MADIEYSLNERQSVVLGATGNGTITMRPSNAHERWVITTTVVSVSTNTLEPKYVTMLNGVEVDSTLTGSGDSSDSVIELNEGSVFTAQWTGGDVGARAVVSLTGKRIQRR